MKKHFIILTILLIVLTSYNVKAATEEKTNYKYTEAQEIIKEVMKDYYIRGPYIQYNYGKGTYRKETPEDATSQNIVYSVCSGYTSNVYQEAFGMDFGRIVTSVMATARKEYEKGNKKNKDFLLYYDKTGTKDRYIINGSFKFKDFVKELQPGDVVLTYGHIMIVYDFVYDSKGNKIDAILLNSAQSPIVKSRIKGTSQLSYNFLYSSIDSTDQVFKTLDRIKQGTLQIAKFSTRSHFFEKGSTNLKCNTEQECAVLRGFYNDNGNVVFNHTAEKEKIDKNKYNKSKLRLEYPGLLIDKTVSKSANNGVYLEDELTYTITITNKSDVSRKYNTKTKKYISEKKEYKNFVIEETIDSKTSYVGMVRTKGTRSGNKITWKIDSLKPGETKTIQYKVKVKNDLSNVDKEIVSEGKFYKNGNNKVSIKLATVRNKILPKSTEISDEKLTSCYNEYKTSYQGLQLIDKIYSCATTYNFDFTHFKFENIIGKQDNITSRSTADSVYIKSKLTGQNKTFVNMILNNYWSGTNYYYHDNPTTIYLPRWNGDSASTRAKTIKKEDFKNGDILIYSINDSKKGTKIVTEPKDKGLYAFIYLGGKFVGINNKGKGSIERNEFTYKFYGDYSNICGGQVTTKLYGGCGNEEFKKLSKSEKAKAMEIVNYQSLFDKDYYVILRPSIVMKEVNNIAIKTQPQKTRYVKSTDKLDLTGGKITVNYNNGTKEELNLKDEGVKVTGFDNTKVGTNKLTITYKNKSTTLNVLIVEIKSIEIKTNPTKLKYIQKQDKLDLTGGEVLIKYSDDKSEVLKMNDKRFTITGFNNTKLGTQKITIKYGAKTTNFNITVIKLSEIKISTLPTKTSYLKDKEKLDLSGGKLTLVYSDNSTSVIDLTDKDITVTGFDNTKVGTNKIKVEYKEKSTTFKVKIYSAEATLKEIKVSTLPTKTSYLKDKEKLDLSGGKLTLVYSDSNTNVINLNSKDVTVTGFDNTKEGTNKLTVTYKNKTTSFNVTITTEPIELKVEDTSTVKIEGSLVKIKIKYNKKFTLKDIKEKLSSSKLEVKNKKGVKITKDSEIIGTGYKLLSDKNYDIILLGDINSDGKISALDYIKIMNHMLKAIQIDEETSKKAADVNEDGRISALDYIRIRNIMGF